MPRTPVAKAGRYIVQLTDDVADALERVAASEYRTPEMHVRKLVEESLGKSSAPRLANGNATVNSAGAAGKVDVAKLAPKAAK